MKKTAIALALALTLTGALTSCGRDRPAEVHSGGTNVSAGQATRQTEAQAKTRDFLDDGRYVAWDNGHVHSGDGNPVTRDLTRSARDMIRDAEDGARDLGRAAGEAGKDLKADVENAGKDLQRGTEQAVKQ